MIHFATMHWHFKIYPPSPYFSPLLLPLFSQEGNSPHLLMFWINSRISDFSGIPFPVNSIGVLPVNYLAETDSFKAENLFRNARQILAQYKKKKSEVKDTAIIFRPFKLSGR